MLAQTFNIMLRCHWLSVVLALAPLGVSSGCYDGQALIKQAEAAALNTTLAEVDLGVFQTTLPRDPKSGRFTTLDAHVFCTVSRSRLSAVTKQLEIDEYRLRHDVLIAIRKCTRDELTDPALASLRARIKEVVNKLLADAPVKEVGFYQITFR